jgi:hypothetical protein
MSLQSYQGFLGPTNQSKSFMADDERTVNMFAEPTESPSAPAPWVLLPTPGLTQLVSVAQAPIRANFSENGRNFFIAGFAFYEYTTAGVTTLRGVVAADANPATICSNGFAGDQLFITSGDVGYCYDLTTNTLTVELPSGATMGAFLDGFFLCLDAATSTLQVSDLFDGTAWNPTQIAQRTAGGDYWQAMYVCNRLIYLLGTETSEVWWNAGTFPFPFAPIQEAFSQHGIAAPFSGAVDTTLTFLGRNKQGRGIVYRMDGYRPNRVSTHALEHEIQAYPVIADAVAGITQQGGHAVYILTFPDADKTKCFDLNTTLWNERMYWDTTNAVEKAYRLMWFTSLPSINVGGDRLTGTLYIIDPDVYTDVGGAAIRRIRQAPRLSMNQARFTVNQLQIVMDVGVSLVLGQGSNAQVMLAVSKDKGKSYGQEQWTSLGEIGEFDTRVTFGPQGQCDNFIPRVMFSDPVPFRLVDCLVDVTMGTS